MNFSTYKEIPKMTDEEILAKTPKYWKQKINEYNTMVRDIAISHKMYKDCIKDKDELNIKSHGLKEKIEQIQNLLKVYDLPVQELIVEYHPYEEKEGYYQKGENGGVGNIFTMTFVNDEIATQRIVTKFWQVKAMEEGYWYSRAKLYIENEYGVIVKCITTPKGREFSWIDTYGERKYFPYGAIVSVKDREGKELYRVSKDDEVVIGKDQYVWEKE